jgi:hypothetical protein
MERLMMGLAVGRYLSMIVVLCRNRDTTLEVDYEFER